MTDLSTVAWVAGVVAGTALCWAAAVAAVGLALWPLARRWGIA